MLLTLNCCAAMDIVFFVDYSISILRLYILLDTSCICNKSLLFVKYILMLCNIS